MESAYVIHVTHDDVKFISDGRVIFKREKEFVLIVTAGMKKVRITRMDESFVESFFPSDCFSLPLENGTYFVKITYQS